MTALPPLHITLYKLAAYKHWIILQVKPLTGLANEDRVRFFKNNSFSVSLNTRGCHVPEAYRSVLNSNGIHGSWQKGPQRGLVQLTTENPISLFILSCEMLCWEEKRSKGNANTLSRFGGKSLLFLLLTIHKMLNLPLWPKNYKCNNCTNDYSS